MAVSLEFINFIHRECLVQLWVHPVTDLESRSLHDECSAVLKSALVQVLEQLYPETREYLSDKGLQRHDQLLG